MIRSRRLIPTKFTFDEKIESVDDEKTSKMKSESASSSSSTTSSSWKLSLLLSLTSIGSILFYYMFFVSIMTKETTISINDSINTNSKLPKVTISSSSSQKAIENNNNNDDDVNRIHIQQIMPKYKKLKEIIYDDFYIRYGGKENAMKLYSSTLYTFNTDTTDKKYNKKQSIEITSLRILKSILSKKNKSDNNNNNFHLSFGGYSITVGRGNYFYQSYPFVLQRIIKPIFDIVGVNFTVRNAAIGGTPSFPYGWCLNNFFGSNTEEKKSNAVSWDFSMNEGNSAMGLEAYVRHAISSFDNPMIITIEKDPFSERAGGTKTRRELLRKYVNDKALGGDVLILDHAFNLDKKLFDLHPLPIGLSNWTDFGAPPGAPGKGKWHPTYRKHELLGWVLAIYFLQSLDHAIELYTSNDYNSIDITKLITDAGFDNNKLLPPPMTNIDNIQDDIISSLFGQPSSSSSETYKMNHISCHTSYKPILQGNILDIIKGGRSSSNYIANDLLSEMNQQTYLKSNGWVYDIGKLERDTKRKLVKFDQLGYIDLKTAYYGIPQSGTLKLSIPINIDFKHTPQSNIGDPTKSSYDFIKRLYNEKQPNEQGVFAQKYIKSLILCQVNEKRTDEECNMESNLNIQVGNIIGSEIISSKLTTITFPGALYLNKPICISVEITDDAQLSISRLPKERNQMVELFVDINVIGDNVSYNNGACSISHVITELNDSKF